MKQTTSFFTSTRERRFWLWSIAVVVAIYSTLGLAGSLAMMLQMEDLLSTAGFSCFILAMVAIVLSGLTRQSGWAEIWVALAVTAAYGMALIRMGHSPEDRTHLFEYGIVGVLLFQALRERARNGRSVRAPAALAVVAAALLGWIDEGLQSLIPNRVYDTVDVATNALAALTAVSASAVISRINTAMARRRSRGQSPR